MGPLAGHLALIPSSCRLFLTVWFHTWTSFALWKSVTKGIVVLNWFWHAKVDLATLCTDHLPWSISTDDWWHLRLPKTTSRCVLLSSRSWTAVAASTWVKWWRAPLLCASRQTAWKRIWRTFIFWQQLQKACEEGVDGHSCAQALGGTHLTSLPIVWTTCPAMSFT